MKAKKEVSREKLEALLGRLKPPFGPGWRRAEQQLTNAASNIAPAEALHVLGTMHEAFVKCGEQIQPTSHAQLALVAMAAGDWRVSLDSMKKGDFDWGRQYFDYFAELGSRALEAGARAEADEAFGCSDSPMALVGRAVVKPKDSARREAAEAAIAAWAGNRYAEVARIDVFRACLRALAGDLKGAKALVAHAKSIDARLAEQSIAETRLPALLGIV